jgi:ATP phosphoribosyltransferase regulatory subunit
LLRATREALLTLLDLYGGPEVLDEARRRLPAHPAIAAALDDLAWLGRHVRAAHPAIEVGFDLSDMSGYAYYSGVRFAVYAPGSTDALLRGGRYDEVGAVFGRNRPAVGFSLDLRQLSAAMPVAPLRAAIRAPWSEDAGLRAAIRALRADNETVVCALAGPRPRDAGIRMRPRTGRRRRPLDAAQPRLSTTGRTGRRTSSF